MLNSTSVMSFVHQQVLTAFHILSHHVVYHNFTSADQILLVFPESFHSNLKNLITKILLENRFDFSLGSFLFVFMDKCVTFLFVNVLVSLGEMKHCPVRVSAVCNTAFIASLRYVAV